MASWDIGAYEFGSASMGIWDIGAYEFVLVGKYMEACEPDCGEEDWEVVAY